MQHSERRILTTHAGSLPRPAHLGELFGQLSRRESIDRAALDIAVQAATRDVIRKQLDVGIDLGNLILTQFADSPARFTRERAPLTGQQPRESFFTYVQHRMSGFGGRSERPRFKDMSTYPTFLKQLAALSAGMKVNGNYPLTV
jgi:5-methyltetrahydropteroyltriglutamate--homocysteine methyltransferase